MHSDSAPRCFGLEPCALAQMLLCWWQGSKVLTSVWAALCVSGTGPWSAPSGHMGPN